MEAVTIGKGEKWPKARAYLFPRNHERIVSIFRVKVSVESDNAMRIRKMYERDGKNELRFSFLARSFNVKMTRKI